MGFFSKLFGGGEEKPTNEQSTNEQQPMRSDITATTPENTTDINLEDMTQKQEVEDTQAKEQIEAELAEEEEKPTENMDQAA